MPFIRKAFFFVVISCLLQYTAEAQADSTVKSAVYTINQILIAGNSKTKPYIILRELSFKQGDTVSLTELTNKFELARQRLYNTRLFNEVIVAVKQFSGYSVDIDIVVVERWYIFPIPYLRPSDRNLSAWAEQGYNFDRLNYGLKLSYYNFSGRNDKLKAWFITGYSRQLRLSYEQPYADKSLRHGFLINFAYSQFKEINGLTLHNKQFFLRSDTISYSGKYLDEQMLLTLGYTYRPAIKTRHTVKLGYGFNKIDSAVSVANPKYFSNNQRTIKYPELRYAVDYNNIDYAAYPLKGLIMEVGLIKKGFTSDMNLLEVYTKGTKSWEIFNKSYFGIQAHFSLKLPFDQPFYNSKLMGYDDMYLRGLEKYVIDGVSTNLVRNTFRRELFNFIVPTTYLRSKSHERVPFKIYLKAYGDVGYVYSKQHLGNNLVNRMLYTAGAGIDVVTLYDVVVRFEYSFNQIGENGLFLHFKNDF